MPLKIQKIVSFIPVANILISLIWIIFLFRTSSDHDLKRYIIPSLEIAGVIALLAIPRILADVLIESDLLYSVVLYSTLYLTVVAMSWIEILDQRKYQKNR